MLSFRYVTLFKYIFIIIKLNVLLLYNKNVQQLYKRISIDSLLDFDCTRKFNIPSEVISMSGKQLIRKLCYKINVTKLPYSSHQRLNFFPSSSQNSILFWYILRFLCHTSITVYKLDEFFCLWVDYPIIFIFSK